VTAFFAGLAAQPGHVSDRDATVFRHHERLSLSGQRGHLIDDHLFLTAIETQGLLLQKCVPGLRTQDTPFFMQRPTVSDFFSKTFKQRDRHLRWLSRLSGFW
jgi:hypothetical protein